MTEFVGLTWDHPRGSEALRAAAFAGLRWDVHPLEGFESSPIEELAERYDLIVLDHPHLGDALAADCLRPMEDFFSPSELQDWATEAVGPSAASYRVGDRAWALPLDAATQVSARRVDLLERAPSTWADVLDLDVTVAPSMAGPHAFLSFCSIAVALGGELEPGLFDRAVALEAFGILSALARNAPPVARELNPIGMLELMSTTHHIAYAPLVYGYVNYANRLAFGPAPASTRTGSTIGGTGIAITRRSEPTAALLDHLRWLMSREAQVGFIPTHNGQPSARSAWTDPGVNAAAGNFYSNTLDTIERSWVRPRFPGYIRFQSEAAAMIREGLHDPKTVDKLATAYRKASA